jgi:hypothetical protein
MRRVEPAYPDLIPVTHVLRPGYLPGPKVSLDPIRMGIVWEDAPRRTLPAHGSVPRHPVRAIVFARVAKARPDALVRLMERGSSVLLVIDDGVLAPEEFGIDNLPDNGSLTVLMPILPAPLSSQLLLPESWLSHRWGAVIGLFPFPGAASELEHNLRRVKEAGATFAVAAPLLLTPKDRHRILDGCDGSGIENQLENCLFHADVSRGLHALERRAGVTLRELGMEPVISCMTLDTHHPNAVRTASLLRLWARRLDQSHEESSWGWRLRRAAAALECLQKDPELLAAEDNLRIVPGFDPWVESFARALWQGGEPLDSAWHRWSTRTGNGDPRVDS